MELPANEVFDLLLSQNQTELYHANTVLTSCTFLRRMELLSREKMDESGYPQTDQETDEKDKRYKVYSDIFLDTMDIHLQGSRVNHYGPVLFVLDIQKLKTLNLVQTVWITKSNPKYWRDTDFDKDRWFLSMEEVRVDFDIYRFNQMIVLRNINGVLPIESLIVKVILDDPQRKTPILSANLFDLSLGALLSSTACAEKNAWRFEKRKCKAGCECVRYYNLESNLKWTAEKFYPAPRCS